MCTVVSCVSACAAAAASSGKCTCAVLPQCSECVAFSEINYVAVSTFFPLYKFNLLTVIYFDCARKQKID